MGNSYKRFEVSIFNQQVRDMDQLNKDHPNFTREWAHLHFLTYDGMTEEDVIQQVRRKHPERKGFVIDKIVEIKEYDFVKPVGRRF